MCVQTNSGSERHASANDILTFTSKWRNKHRALSTVYDSAVLTWVQGKVSLQKRQIKKVNKTNIKETYIIFNFIELIMRVQTHTTKKTNEINKLNFFITLGDDPCKHG